MKKYFLAFFICTIALGEGVARYNHILDETGKVLATIDTQKNNEIEYKVDPKVVVTRLLKTVSEIQNQCNQAIQRYETQKAQDAKWFWQK